MNNSRPTNARNAGTIYCPGCDSTLPDLFSRCPVCGLRLNRAGADAYFWTLEHGDSVRVLSTALAPTVLHAIQDLGSLRVPALGYTWSEAPEEVAA